MQSGDRVGIARLASAALDAHRFNLRARVLASPHKGGKLRVLQHEAPRAVAVAVGRHALHRLGRLALGELALRAAKRVLDQRVLPPHKGERRLAVFARARRLGRLVQNLNARTLRLARGVLGGAV